MSIAIEYQVQGHANNEWTIYHAHVPTMAEAETVMYSLLENGLSHTRIVEVKTVITHKVVSRAANMGSTDQEIVDAVVEGRHLR